MSMKRPLWLLTFILWGVTACGKALVTPEVTGIPTLPVYSIKSTPTQWLPYNPYPTNTGCGQYVATLPTQHADGLSKEQLAQHLLEVYLEHYKSPDLGSQCRLEEYIVKNARLDRSIDFLAAEQNVDYVGTVRYSVQISEVPSDWVAGNGNLEKEGWVADKGLIIGVTKINDQYILKLIGTGP